MDKHTRYRTEGVTLKLRSRVLFKVIRLDRILTLAKCVCFGPFYHRRVLYCLVAKITSGSAFNPLCPLRPLLTLGQTLATPPPPPAVDPRQLWMLQETKYSRIPVYSGEIDRISGVVLSKELLDFVQVKISYYEV